MLKSGLSSQSCDPGDDVEGFSGPSLEDLDLEAFEVSEEDCGVEVELLCDCLAFDGSNPGGGLVSRPRSSCKLA